VKRNSYLGDFAQLFFWRTHEQQEIDLAINLKFRNTHYNPNNLKINLSE
jgi:hypothetical protein